MPKKRNKEYQKHCHMCRHFNPNSKLYGDYGACAPNGTFKTFVSKYHKECVDFAESYVSSLFRKTGSDHGGSGDD